MRYSLLTSLFPPPAYLTMPSIGLDISDRSIHGLGFERSSRGIDVAKHFEHVLPANVIVDGKVALFEQFVAELRRMRKEHRLTFVNVSLPERHGYVFSLTLPATDPRDIRGAIEARLEEHVPLSVSEAVFDYTLEGGGEEGEGARLTLGVSVYPREIVDTYLDAFIESELVPLRMEIDVSAIARAVVPHDAPGVTMVVDIGHANTIVAVVSDQVVRYSSSISKGAQTIVNALSEAADIPYTDAEHLIHEYGLKVEIDGHPVEEVHNAADDLVSAVLKHFHYWNSHHALKDNEVVDRVLMCGGGINMKGLIEVFDARLDVPLDYANVFVNVFSLDERIPSIPFSTSIAHAAAIGLAMDV